MPALPTIASMSDVACTEVAEARCTGPERNHRYAKVAKPARVYKQPVSNKTLRGLDVREIGEGSELSDKSFFMMGDVEILEQREARCKVSGYGRAGSRSRTYSVTGWIGREEMT